MPFETENGASNGNGLSSTLITLGIIAQAATVGPNDLM